MKNAQDCPIRGLKILDSINSVKRHNGLKVVALTMEELKEQGGLLI